MRYVLPYPCGDSCCRFNRRIACNRSVTIVPCGPAGTCLSKSTVARVSLCGDARGGYLDPTDCQSGWITRFGFGSNSLGYGVPGGNERLVMIVREGAQATTTKLLAVAQRTPTPGRSGGFSLDDTCIASLAYLQRPGKHGQKRRGGRLALHAEGAVG